MNWVSDYVDIAGEDLKELAVKITKSGVNVEKVITNKIDNLVVGQIKKVTKHPDSDHLNLCMVDTGNDVVQIVCGASNVKEGLKVIVALPGAVLPGNFEIKKGEAIGQALFQKYLITDDDKAEGKRMGGFGSTRK